MTYHPEPKETKTTLKGRITRIVFFLLLIAAGIGTILYRDAIMSRMSKVIAASEEDPIPVQVLQQEAFQLEVPAFGEIIGLGSVPVSTPSTRSGGLKVAWLVPEGSFVKAGDLVVRFDSTDATLNLQSQTNTLVANEQRTGITTGKQTTDSKVLTIDRTDAQKEYDYALTVMPQDETIFSKWDIIEAKLNADYAKERIDFLSNKSRFQQRIARADQQILAIERNKALGEIQIARQTLDALELRSPADGLLIYRRDRRRDPQVGDESHPGQVLVEVVDLAALQARIYVLERDSGSLAKDKPVVIRMDAIPDREFNGILKGVSALAQPLERNSPLKYFSCEVTITDAGESLRKIKPGMSLEAKVILEKYEDCYVVPSSAVTVKGTENLVYIQQADRFVPRAVRLGMGLHGQSTILSGVQNNEIIALRNPFEERKAYLPDFSKGGAQDQRGGRGGPGGGPGREIRMMIQ